MSSNKIIMSFDNIEKITVTCNKDDVYESGHRFPRLKKVKTWRVWKDEYEIEETIEQRLAELKKTYPKRNFSMVNGDICQFNGSIAISHRVDGALSTEYIKFESEEEIDDFIAILKPKLDIMVDSKRIILYVKK